MSLKLLIAEDAREVADIVAFGARMIWPDCQVAIAANGAEALQRFTEMQPDLVVLDIAMPPPDGFAVCQQIRAASPVPILMLTVRKATLDKVRALDLGADDYLTKPFDHLELLARLRALARRTGRSAGAPHTHLTSGALTLDCITREARIAGAVVALTSTEYHLLEVLMQHPGVVLPHAFLLEQVWGPEYQGDVHYLAVFVQRLRRKLGDDADSPRCIQTEWGIGYRFVPPARESRGGDRGGC